MKKENKNSDKITFVDLFAGIGGFHSGIKQAAENLGFDAECVLAVDKDERARVTYNKNFKKTPLREDVTDPAVQESVPEDVDIVCGGFPCQPFSQAGKKLGIKDDRGTLFEHIAAILEKRQPKVVFLENVRNLKNIKNDDGEPVIDLIKKRLEDAGYLVLAPKVFKATDFGLPTHRPRIYLIGLRKDIFSVGDFRWPEPTCKKAPTLAGYFQNRGVLDETWNGRVKRNGWPNCVGNTLRVGGIGSGFRTKNGQRVRDRRNWDSYLFHEGTNKQEERGITVDEAKAIMGFPHDFEFGKLSRAQALRQLGNSVAVPVIQAIAESIIKTLHGRSNNA